VRWKESLENEEQEQEAKDKKKKRDFKTRFKDNRPWSESEIAMIEEYHNTFNRYKDILKSNKNTVVQTETYKLTDCVKIKIEVSEE